MVYIIKSSLIIINISCIFSSILVLFFEFLYDVEGACLGCWASFGFPQIVLNILIYYITQMTDPAEEPVPTTKQELIEMLKTQLEKVQDQITSIQTNLEEQRQRRKQLTAELEQRQQKIKQLIENQSKTLGDKVHEGLYKTLEAANKMRADADAQIRKLAEDNTVLNQKIINKDNVIIEDKGKIVLNAKQIAALEQKKIDAQRKQQNLKDKKEQVQKNLEMMKQQLQRIEREERQLRNHIENMKKLRLYLNKHLQGSLKTNQGAGRANKQSLPDNFWGAQ